MDGRVDVCVRVCMLVRQNGKSLPSRAIDRLIRPLRSFFKRSYPPTPFYALLKTLLTVLMLWPFKALFVSIYLLQQESSQSGSRVINRHEQRVFYPPVISERLINLKPTLYYVPIVILD